MWEDAEGEHVIPQGRRRRARTPNDAFDAFIGPAFCFGSHSGRAQRMQWFAPSLKIFMSSLQTHIAMAHLHNIATALALERASGSTVERPKWNRAGIRPRGCEALERIAQLSDLMRVAKRRGHRCAHRSRDHCPLGDAAFIQAHLEVKVTEQRTLLDRIFFDERLYSLALRVGESQFLAQGGRAPGGG